MAQECYTTKQLKAKNIQLEHTRYHKLSTFRSTECL